LFAVIAARFAMLPRADSMERGLRQGWLRRRLACAGGCCWQHDAEAEEALHA
jgi:hypothetical protein